MGHTLGWDEAWNANCVEDFARGNTEEASTFFPNFFRHPPAYLSIGTVYAILTGADRFGIARFLQYLSIFFSALLVLAIYLCARKWFGEIAGVSSSLLFAIIPAARVYDTWVKQESMTLFFCLLFLYLFTVRKWVLSGVVLALAFLTKEIAIFIPAALFLSLIAAKRFGELKKLFAVLAFPVVLCGWWYLFFSRTKGEFVSFFLGEHKSALTWKQPWHFYLERLPADLGYLAAAICTGGLILLCFKMMRGKQDKGSENTIVSIPHRENESRTSYVLPLVWVGITYITLSVSVGKPPWMTYSALPAFAVAGGVCVSQGFHYFRSKSTKLALPTLALLFALLFASNIPVSYDSYVRRGDALHDVAVESRRAAQRINRARIAEPRVMMTDSALTPVFTYYLEGYESGSMFLLPFEPVKVPVARRHRIFLLEDRTNLDRAIYYFQTLRPHFFFAQASGALGKELSGYIKPYRFGRFLLFDLREVYGLQPVPGAG